MLDGPIDLELIGGMWAFPGGLKFGNYFFDLRLDSQLPPPLNLSISLAWKSYCFLLPLVNRQKVGGLSLLECWGLFVFWAHFKATA